MNYIYKAATHLTGIEVNQKNFNLVNNTELISFLKYNYDNFTKEAQNEIDVYLNKTNTTEKLKLFKNNWTPGMRSF